MYRERLPNKALSEHGYDRPDDQGVIWRYLSFSKFIDLITKNSLPLIRVDRFEDPYEGTLPHGNLITALESGLTGIELEKINKNPKILARKARQCVFVNCWHINEHESAAFWKIYFSDSEGLAIRSSFGRLKECSANSPLEVDAANVKYIDYKADKVLAFPFNMMALSMHKRKSFDFERELRVIHWDGTESMEIIRGEREENTKTYIPVAINVDLLIEKVFVAPTSSMHFKETVESVMSKYGLVKEVGRSSLADGPIW